jgi:hypothetical protein
LQLINIYRSSQPNQPSYFLITFTPLIKPVYLHEQYL